MNELNPAGVRSEALRLQSVLEETLDQHDGQDETTRTDALATRLRDELARLAPTSRQEVLALLDVLFPAESVTAASDAALRSRCRELEDELVRMRLAPAVPASATLAHAPMPTSTAFAREVARLMLGGRDPDEFLTSEPAAEARMLGIMRQLLAFTEDLARVFLGATVDPERTMAGQLHSVVVEELLGRAADGGLALQLRQIQVTAGQQMVAFRGACEAGARGLLKKISPAAFEATITKDANWMVRSGPLFYKECWALYEKAHDTLKDADDLYGEYFDGLFRAELGRLQHQAKKKAAR